MPLSRAAMFVSPMGPRLALLSMSGRETMGRPFAFEVDLVSDDDSLDLAEILARPAGVLLERLDGSIREFNGLVTEFALAGEQGNFARYRVVLRPALWFLGQNRKCRIFQNKTVPEIVEELLRERGLTDFQILLSENHRTWEYLVQYRESELSFIHRILEQEGIYYFFRHQEGKHIMVLVDSFAAHEAVEGFATVPFFPPLESGLRLQEHIDSWVTKRQIRPDRVRLVDFNFESPLPFSTENAVAPLDNDHGDAEVVDFPAEAVNKAEAEIQAKLQLEALQADHEVSNGAGPVRGLFAGAKFKLSQFPRDDQNKEFVIVSAAYEISTAEFESNSAENRQPVFRFSLSAIDAKQQYRLPRVTRKPTVEGPQTALVVGPQENEIFTDPFGRVKLKFHWDSTPETDASVSCFVRVSQVWAGDGWGAMHIPRIGQEVIVSFLEGDPDRPIVTGRVYNGFNRPPYPLPDNQTQSGIRSHSTPRGSPQNFNEIRFEDKKGAEDLLLRAERSQTTSVKGSQSISVGGERSVSVTGKDSQTFKNTRTINVTGEDTLILLAHHDGAYLASRDVAVTGHDVTLVVGNKLDDVEGPFVLQSTEQLLAKQGANNRMRLEGATAALTNSEALVTMDGPVMELNADSKVTIKVGGSFITIEAGKIEVKSAEIVLNGDNIKITGGTSVSLSGGGSTVELKAGTASVSSATVDIKGSAQVKLNS